MSSEIVAQASKEEGRMIARETSIVGVPQSLAQTIEIAKVMAASGLYPDYGTAQKATGAIVIGAQYGLSPAQSLGAIHIVKGKPMLHYSLILSKVREHPDYDYRIVSATEERAEIEFIRHDAVCGREVFTLAQARKQGTQNLDKFPDTMLLARAVSKGVKKFCPDVLNGMPTYVQGEIEESEAGWAKPQSKGDSLRAEMQAKAEEIARKDEAITVEAEEVDPMRLSTDEEDEADDDFSELDAFNLTNDQLRDFQAVADANGVNLEDVAKECEVKTAESLEAALSQGSLL